MTFSVDIDRVEKVAYELNNALEKFSPEFNSGRNNLDVTTSSGRTYKVANVLEASGEWVIIDEVSKGMFLCHKCGQPPKTHHGNSWLQFTRGENVVRVHSSLIHLFRTHPTHVPEATLEKAASVFLA